MRVVLHTVCQGYMAIQEWENVVVVFFVTGIRGRKNVVAALYESSIIRCSIIEDNIDTNVFNTWVEKILIPDLPNKSVVVMSNAAFHKSKKIKALLESNGRIIAFLPPYSPDFNPIENRWAQAKYICRKLTCNVDEVFKSHVHNSFILI